LFLKTNSLSGYPEERKKSGDLDSQIFSYVEELEREVDSKSVEG
jgi:hypothetical protein